MDNKWAMKLNWNLRKEMNNKWVMELNWNHAINTLNNSKIEPIQTKSDKKCSHKQLNKIIWNPRNLEQKKEFGFKS